MASDFKLNNNASASLHKTQLGLELAVLTEAAEAVVPKVAVLPTANCEV